MSCCSLLSCCLVYRPRYVVTTHQQTNFRRCRWPRITLQHCTRREWGFRRLVDMSGMWRSFVVMLTSSDAQLVFGGIVLGGISRGFVWAGGNCGGYFSRGNVFRNCSGWVSGFHCRIIRFDRQYLWFMLPGLTQTHTDRQLLTGLYCQLRQGIACCTM